MEAGQKKSPKFNPTSKNDDFWSLEKLNRLAFRFKRESSRAVALWRPDQKRKELRSGYYNLKVNTCKTRHNRLLSSLVVKPYGFSLSVESEEPRHWRSV